MIEKTLKLQVYPALLAGTLRQPISLRDVLSPLGQLDSSIATLHALSLTGQLLRFEPPASPTNFLVEETIKDLRPIVENEMRRPLIRLLNGKKPNDDLALALAWAFDRHKVRPHPFDLPRIESFATSHAELLGATAQHWAQQRDTSPAAPGCYFDAEEVNETTWAQGSLSQRAHFIKQHRTQDAKAALSLIESVWSQENADARFRLLQTIETGLSASDQPFLETLKKDRAPRVRALAERFLARITGYSGAHPALKAVVERIRRSTTGLLKKRSVLSLELPVNVREHEVNTWLREAFSEVSCDELARSLELTDSQLIEAAEKDLNLSIALAFMATQDRRFDLLQQLASNQLTEAWEKLSDCGPVDLSMMTSGERQQWATILIQPVCTDLPAFSYRWSWLHRCLGGPAPATLTQHLLRNTHALPKFMDDHRLSADWLEVLVGLCPSSDRKRLRPMIAAMDTVLTQNSMPLLDLLESIEKVGNHE